MFPSRFETRFRLRPTAPDSMTPTPSEPDSNLRALARTQKFLAVSIGVILSLSALLLFHWGRPPSTASLEDPALIARAVEIMMGFGDGHYDSHPDPDAAKVLQPNMKDVHYHGSIALNTNAFGVRERDWAIPKPEGMLRVVILGDSFVLGSGINAEQRMGTHLERYLRQRMPGYKGDIEVLQIGMGSWNIRAECAYARRQLSLLQPDLLIHILVNNDLDDTLSVRGFGGFATMSPQQPSHVTGTLHRRYPRQHLRGKYTGWLSNGMDWESRSRFASSLEDLKELQRAVVRQGGKYQLLFAWGKLQQAAYYGLGQHFSEEDTSYMSPHFGKQLEHRVSKTDGHWGALGNENVAKMLYSLIVERELLQKTELALWASANELREEYFGRGRIEAMRDRPIVEWLDAVPIASQIRFGVLDDAERAQIHGGIVSNGRVCPYGSMILALKGGHLEIDGRGLPRQELAGMDVKVYLDEFLVQTLKPTPGKPFEIRVAVPEQLALREFASLRFHSSDYAYIGADMRDCVSLWLDRVAILD